MNTTEYERASITTILKVSNISLFGPLDELITKLTSIKDSLPGVTTKVNIIGIVGNSFSLEVTNSESDEEYKTRILDTINQKKIELLVVQSDLNKLYEIINT